MGDGSQPRREREADDLEAELARHLPQLSAYLRLRMGRELRTKESVSDLVQSACREVLQHRDRFQHRGEAQFRHWLYKTAQRKLLNRLEYWRAEKREVAREHDVQADPGGDDALAAMHLTLSTPSRSLIRRELAESIEAAFQELSEPHREVILLSRIVGLSHEDVAREMGRTVSATRSLLHRALAELAERLTAPEQDA